ncbi:MAG TPA: hypothetical protein VGK78_00755 [Nocardioides sp.]
MFAELDEVAQNDDLPVRLTQLIEGSMDGVDGGELVDRIGRHRRLREDLGGLLTPPTSAVTVAVTVEERAVEVALRAVGPFDLSPRHETPEQGRLGQILSFLAVATQEHPRANQTSPLSAGERCEAPIRVHATSQRPVS